jgi:cytochrome P450
MTSLTRLNRAPHGDFVFGHTRAVASDRLGFFTDIHRRYGDFVEIRLLLGKRAYLLNDPDLVKGVLVDHPEYVHKTPNFKSATRSTIGEGLLTSEGEFHKRQCRLAQPAFHHQRVGAYSTLMVDLTLEMLEQRQHNQVFDLHEAMMQLTMRIVARALFNADVAQDAEAIGHAISDGLHDTSERVTNPLVLPEWLPTPRNLAGRRRIALLHRTIDHFIEDRHQSDEDRGDLLSMLLLAQDDDGSRMSDKQVRDVALTLFIAGHETTANALTWTFYLLAQHPQIEALLHKEVDQVLGGRVPAMDDLAHLPCVRMIVKEAMRLYPPAWIVPCIAIQSFELAGHMIQKGDLLFNSPYTMHRHPGYFPSPESFIPERWTDAFEKNLPKYAYYPFGGGPRICIGNGFALLEAQLVLATIAQHNSFTMIPGQTIMPEAGITLRPRNGIQMRIAERYVIQPEAVLA